MVKLMVDGQSSADPRLCLSRMACLPARFRRPRLLVVGCGDVGLRVLRLVGTRFRVVALTSSPQRRQALRAAGAVPLVGDLDDAASLGRLGALAHSVLHLAPPPAEGERDPRTARLVRTLARAGSVRRVVYASTSGVYGDCSGAWIDETRRPDPQTARARRRTSAEAWLRRWGRAADVTVSVLRVPGIYARDREGGDPCERVARRTPALLPEHDVHTNHIHADDLARACVAALYRGAPQRVYHVCDDSRVLLGDWLDRAADLCRLPRPPRISRTEARARFTPLQLSFLAESRRLRNDRLKRELRVVLRYPTLDEAFARSPPAA
jgi:nucleoside-diphosphate-sugar epimerase